MCFISYKYSSASTSICKVSSFILHTDFQAYFASLNLGVNTFFLFQMVALNFECILVMLKDGGTIPRNTLCSQDGINLGDIRFCPIMHTLCMQCISLNGLCTLLSEGAFAPPHSNTPPELSGMMAILLVFQADSEHERIINVYVGLVVRRVDSHLYSPSQINNFIQDIEVNLREARGALKAGHDAFLWTISVALCPSQQTLPIVWCIPPLMSKALSPIISTLRTVPWGCACTAVYAEPPCSSVTLIPSSALNTQGVASLYPVGCSTMTICILLS